MSDSETPRQEEYGYEDGRILIFYRGAWTFRSLFAMLTKPSILDISAPFAISRLVTDKCVNVHPLILRGSYLTIRSRVTILRPDMESLHIVLVVFGRLKTCLRTL